MPAEGRGWVLSLCALFRPRRREGKQGGEISEFISKTAFAHCFMIFCLFWSAIPRHIPKRQQKLRPSRELGHTFLFLPLLSRPLIRAATKAVQLFFNLRVYVHSKTEVQPLVQRWYVNTATGDRRRRSCLASLERSKRCLKIYWKRKAETSAKGVGRISRYCYRCSNSSCPFRNQSGIFRYFFTVFQCTSLIVPTDASINWCRIGVVITFFTSLNSFIKTKYAF